MKVFFNFSSVTEFSSEIVEISGRYESKFLLEGDILETIFISTLIKKISSNLSVVTFSSVIHVSMIQLFLKV